MTTHPRRILLTVLHLLVLGSVGTALIGALLGLLGAGLATALVFGVGLVLLTAVVYACFGLAWFEVERVVGLYRLNLPALTLRRPTSPGFGGYLRSLLAQSVDGRMWRALANFAVGAVLGAVVIGLLRMMIALPGSLSGIFGVANGFWNGDFSSPVRWIVVAVSALIAGAGVIGIALLYRVISIGIISAGAREEELRQQVQTTSQQREGAVRAADVERTRIERDLHDGVQPRLVSVAMTLGLAQQKIDSDPDAAKELVAEAHASTKAAITELRQLARGIYASVLDDRGLDAALSALAARSHVPVHLDVRIDGRCARQAEAAIYFAIAESLTNAAKHSRASESRVVVRRRDDGQLWAKIEDNGIGGATVVSGGGLDGISNRVVAAGGTVQLDSPAGGPTYLEVSVPCAS